MAKAVIEGKISTTILTRGERIEVELTPQIQSLADSGFVDIISVTEDEKPKATTKRGAKKADEPEQLAIPDAD